MSYKAKILDRQFISEENYLLKLEKPEGFQFKPGQFVGVNATINNEKIKRFYSIASLPEENFLLFYIRRVPNGKMSNYLATAPIGSELELDNPMGHFTLDRSKSDKVVFIAAGTGIAPMRPLAYEALKQGKKVKLIHQEKYEKLLVFKDEFEKLPIEYIPIISRENTTKYWKGHVQDYLDRIFEADADYYLCGSPNFVMDIKKRLEERGAKNIVIEAF